MSVETARFATTAVHAARNHAPAASRATSVYLTAGFEFDDFEHTADHSDSGDSFGWRGWDPDALVADRGTAVYADGSCMNAVCHRGEYYAFDGPLIALPFPNGEPALVSLDGSGRSLGFAGANSDVRLALAPLHEESVRAYRAKIHDAAVAAGRRPSDIKILFTIQPVITSWAEEADRIVAASAQPDDATLVQIARKQSSDLETDLAALDLDRPIDPAVFGPARVAGQHPAADRRPR